MQGRGVRSALSQTLRVHQGQKVLVNPERLAMEDVVFLPLAVDVLRVKDSFADYGEFTIF